MLECSATGNEQITQKLSPELRDYLATIDPVKEAKRHAFTKGLIELATDTNVEIMV